MIMDILLWIAMGIGIWFGSVPIEAEESPTLFRTTAIILACGSAIVIGMRLML